jgi:hypothetical protein
LSKVEPIERLFQWLAHSAHSQPITLTKGVDRKIFTATAWLRKSPNPLRGMREQYRNLLENVKSFRGKNDVTPQAETEKA